MVASGKAGFQALLTARPEPLHEWAPVLAHATQSAQLRSKIRTLRRVSDRLDAWLDTNKTLPAERPQDLAAEIEVTREAIVGNYREAGWRKTTGDQPS